MKLTAEQTDRALGAVVGAAVGDALGAGYEFNHADPELVPDMIGGGLGPFAPGEWTDDTSMTWGVLEAAALVGSELKSPWGLQLVAFNFYDWLKTRPKDIGGTTYASLSAGPTVRWMTERADEVNGLTNGSLMRTAPVALAYLDDPWGLAGAARAVSALTHSHLDAQEACAVWSLGIRKAVLTGEFDLYDGIHYLHKDSREFIRAGIDFAAENDPMSFWANGEALVALQAAWSSIVNTPGSGFVDSLTTAIRIGYDTDTVASICGAMLGARWGLSAIPVEWTEILHGYPEKTCDDLVEKTREVLTQTMYGW